MSENTPFFTTIPVRGEEVKSRLRRAYAFPAAQRAAQSMNASASPRG